jgi:hypothetical protein
MNFTLLPSALGIPKAISSPLYLFHHAHCAWRWHRTAQDVLSETDNFKKLAAGIAFRWFVGDSLLLRISAQAIVIMRRLIDLSQQQLAFAESFHLLKDALKGKTIIRMPLSTQISKKYRLLSPSSLIPIKDGIRHFFLVAIRIAYCIYHFLAEAFKLSMCMADLIEAFSISPSQNELRVNMLFVNTSKLCDSLSGSREELIDELRKNESAIEHLLTQVCSRYKVKDLINGLEKTLEKTEQAARMIGNIPVKLYEGLKEGSYTLLYSTFRWAPRALLEKEKTAVLSCPSLRRYYDDNISVYTPCPC